MCGIDLLCAIVSMANLSDSKIYTVHCKHRLPNVQQKFKC